MKKSTLFVSLIITLLIALSSSNSVNLKFLDFEDDLPPEFVNLNAQFDAFLDFEDDLPPEFVNLNAQIDAFLDFEDDLPPEFVNL